MSQNKSIIGRAVEKSGIKVDENGATVAGSSNASSRRASEDLVKESKTLLRNRAGESKSPYVRGHRNNPVAWQLWGDETIELAKKQNKLMFISIGYSACHWCHVMEKESFENEEVAAILNRDFIPIKIDREERPDIDRIYMNFVQATTGSGGWPLNVFVTPALEPVFGGTYWPGPKSHTRQLELEEQVNFLSILQKLATAWSDQEARCRQDSAQILEQLRNFAAEGTLGAGSRQGSGNNLDLDLLDEAYQHLAKTFDATHFGFGSAPKFATPAKLSFLLRLQNCPEPVIDIVGTEEIATAQFMALSTMRAMDRGGIHDHIGHGFARYSVTADWSLPHFEKMLYDNAQLLHVYLDAFLGGNKPDAEFLGVVYDLANYLTTAPIAAPNGGFYSSLDSDSYYRKGDEEKREGAYYVWTQREIDQVVGKSASEIVCAFFGVETDGNVQPQHDVHDEFINQNVLKISKTPEQLGVQFGMTEQEVVSIIKDAKKKLRAHREAERVPPNLDDKIVCGWNGIAIGALARTGAALKSVDEDFSKKCYDAATKAASFIKKEMYDESSKALKRVWREGPGETGGFADDYAYLIEGLIDLYEATFDDQWLQWADALQKTQISLFLDPETGGFFATPSSATHTILRLKDGMDNAEPSTNGVSACNLFRLGSLLSDEYYKSEAKRTMEAFEAEMLQYPWLFASFLTGVVAGEVPVLRSVRIGAKKGGSAEADVSDSATEAIHALRLGAAKAMQADAAVSAAAAAKAEPELAEKAVEKVGGADADDDESEAKVMAKPRGALETTVYLDETHGLWLRERDPDLKVRPKETERKVIPMHCPWRASD